VDALPFVLPFAVEALAGTAASSWSSPERPPPRRGGDKERVPRCSIVGVAAAELTDTAGSANCKRRRSSAASANPVVLLLALAVLLTLAMRPSAAPDVVLPPDGGGGGGGTSLAPALAAASAASMAALCSRAFFFLRWCSSNCVTISLKWSISMQPWSDSVKFLKTWTYHASLGMGTSPNQLKTIVSPVLFWFMLRWPVCKESTKLKARSLRRSRQAGLSWAEAAGAGGSMRLRVGPPG